MKSEASVMRTLAATTDAASLRSKATTRALSSTQPHTQRLMQPILPRLVVLAALVTGFGNAAMLRSGGIFPATLQNVAQSMIHLDPARGLSEFCLNGGTEVAVVPTKSLDNKGASGCNVVQCDACQGDCDRDSHCSGNLICWQRTGKTPVPGCLSGGSGDANNYDYCVQPGPVTNIVLENKGGNGCNNPNHPCNVCEGDCDSDSHCEGSLICFQRGGDSPVPGCAAGGSGDKQGYDYCMDPRHFTLTCNCESGFDGDRCENNIDECALTPCQNGGTCTDGIASRSCTCLAGYDGYNCEDCNTGWIMENSQCIEVEETACHPSPCQNGGSCSVTSEENGFSCACTGDWIGDMCDHKTCGQDNGCIHYDTGQGGTHGIQYLGGCMYDDCCSTDRGGWAWPIHGWSSTNQRCCEVGTHNWLNSCHCPPGYRTRFYTRQYSPYPGYDDSNRGQQTGCYATTEAQAALATTWLGLGDPTLGPQFWWLPQLDPDYRRSYFSYGWNTPGTTPPQPNAQCDLVFP